VKSSYLYVNHLRLHYYYENLAGTGSPIVLLHGLASNGRIWEKVLPHLAQAGHPCYAPDLRGHGLSDKPDRDFSFDSYFKDLAAIIDALALETLLVVGHSWGASLALDYAARRSFGRNTPTGIVLVDGGVIQLDAVEGATWEETRQRLAPPRLAGTPLGAFMAHFQAPEARWRPSHEEIQIILANFEISADERITPHLSFEHHMQIVRAMWEFHTFERYEKVRCPVLAVPARPSPPLSEAEFNFLNLKKMGISHLQGLYPDKFRVRWMDDSIHDIPLQHAKALSRLIVDFAGQVG
jgi:pimeloyl-ACP methyl ester carboxylesterase